MLHKRCPSLATGAPDAHCVDRRSVRLVEGERDKGGGGVARDADEDEADRQGLACGLVRPGRRRRPGGRAECAGRTWESLDGTAWPPLWRGGVEGREAGRRRGGRGPAVRTGGGVVSGRIRSVPERSAVEHRRAGCEHAGVPRDDFGDAPQALERR